MSPTNEAIIWAASIQVASSIHAVELRKAKPSDRPRLLMEEAAYFYHAAMDCFPMAKSVDWWMNQLPPRPSTKSGPSRP